MLRRVGHWPVLLKRMARRKLRVLGHRSRQQRNYVEKEFFGRNDQWKESQRKPGTRWMDTRNWTGLSNGEAKSAATDRVRWRGIVEDTTLSLEARWHQFNHLIMLHRLYELWLSSGIRLSSYLNMLVTSTLRSAQESPDLWRHISAHLSCNTAVTCGIRNTAMQPCHKHSKQYNETLNIMATKLILVGQ